MSSDFPTFAEIGEENVKARMRRDDIRYQILMGNAPKEWLDMPGVAK